LRGSIPKTSAWAPWAIPSQLQLPLAAIERDTRGEGGRNEIVHKEVAQTSETSNIFLKPPKSFQLLPILFSLTLLVQHFAELHRCRVMAEGAWVS